MRVEFIDFIKQPNGKYCYFNHDGKVEKHNLTEQDITDMYIEFAKTKVDNAEHFGNIISNTVSNYDSRVKAISNDVLKEMGFDKTYHELVKFVPRKPSDKRYVSVNFETIGKCPNCGEKVVNGMGGRDDKCGSCGQLLEWGK